MRYYSGLRGAVIAVVIAIGLLLSGLQQPVWAGESAFSDLSTQQYAYPYVKYLVDHGIISGYGDGSFRPGARLSRAEMAVLMVRAAGLAAAPATATPHYKDVAPDFWGYASIEAATRAGFLKGYDDGTFRPGEPVSRAEAAAIILRMTAAPLPDIALPSAVTDVPSGHWARQVIAVAVDSAIMPMAAKTGFAPDIPASRAETARGLAIMLNVMPEKADVGLTGTLVPIKGQVTLTAGSGVSRIISTPVSCSAGSVIKTGTNSTAEIRFPDGSGLKLDENTTITIKKAEGQATILKSGLPGALVDSLEINLSEGRLLGAMAVTYNNEENHQTARARTYRYALASADDTWALLLAADETEKAGLPWYKEPYQKKVRVKVDMPWGVAAVRGTVWMNQVASGTQSTSVVDGTVEVSSGTQSYNVQAGQAAQQSSSGQMTPPRPLTAQEQQLWTAQQSWIAERASSMEQSAPVVVSPLTIQQQVQQAPSQVTVPPPAQQAAPAQTAPANQLNTPIPTENSSNINNVTGLANRIITSISQVIGTNGASTALPPSTPAPAMGGGGGGGGGGAPAGPVSGGPGGGGSSGGSGGDPAMDDSAGIPELPAAFMGTVKDQAGNAIAQGTIEVVIDGVVRASKSFSNGNFGTALGDRLVVNKAYYNNASEIVFKVNGHAAIADPSVDWASAGGNLTRINLTVDGI